MVQDDDGDLGHAELPGCSQAGVARDDRAVRRHQQRIGPPKFNDAGRHLSHLLDRVGARVAEVRQQPVDRPHQDLQAREIDLHQDAFRFEP
jgi:hypothetical protein